MEKLIFPHSVYIGPENVWVQFRPTHRHIKTGRLYMRLTVGVKEDNLEDYTVYSCTEGRVWMRPTKEFNDPDRFERLNADE
jgi:hypothetical protein